MGRPRPPAPRPPASRSELRQVAWPNRSEVINYTTVTLVTLLSLMVLIFILNYAFAKGVLWLFKT